MREVGGWTDVVVRAEEVALVLGRRTLDGEDVGEGYVAHVGACGQTGRRDPAGLGRAVDQVPDLCRFQSARGWGAGGGDGRRVEVLSESSDLTTCSGGPAHRQPGLEPSKRHARTEDHGCVDESTRHLAGKADDARGLMAVPDQLGFSFSTKSQNAFSANFLDAA